jgi:hypothetical protein
MAVDFHEVQQLENNLNRQLHVEGFAGTDAGSAVEVTDGIADQAESTVIRVVKG